MYIDTTNNSSGRICLNAGHADTAQNADYATESNYAQSANSATSATTAASCSGNAATATKLTTARTISLTGDVTGSGSFDGSSNLSIAATVVDNSHNHTNYLPLAGGTMTGTLKVSGNSQGGVEIRSDNEGGNIVIESGNDHSNYWEIDSFDGNLRMYTYRESDSAFRSNTLYQDDGYWENARYASNSDTVDGYHATSFGINRNVGDADLNTCTQSGFYRLGGTITNGYSNASWGQMLVVHGAGDTICQVGMPYNERALYIRQGNPTDVGGSGSWQGWKRLWGAGDAVTGAVWNDYAECREADTQEAGYVMIENGDDTLSKSTERLQQFAGISSDTWGFSQGETEKAKTHIAVAGRVLVYPYRNRNEYKPGDAVCTAPGGTVDIMTDEEIIKYPHRIVGTVSCVPDYETWGGGEGADRDPVEVNGRIWIKVR